MPNGAAASGPRSLADRPTRTTKKRISDDEWQMHKDNIERLYLDEGRDVREVRDTMKREYAFDAHEKAYKRKFEEWGLIKNIPKEEGLFMVKKRERRREDEGKETIFRRRRRPDGPLQLVLDEKVDRIGDRYSHDLNNYPEHPATPDNIEYETPHGTPREERAHPPHPQPMHHDQQPVRPQASIATSNSEWAYAPIAPLQAPGHQHHDSRPQYYVQEQPGMHHQPQHGHHQPHHNQHQAHLPPPHHQHPNALPQPHPMSHPQAHPQHAQHPTHAQHAPHAQHPQHSTHLQHAQHAQHPQHPQHGHPQHPPAPGQPHGNWDPWGHPYF